MQIVLKSGRAVNISVQKKHVKNITLRVYADGGVKVSAPHGMPDAAVRGFVEGKKDWLEKRLTERDGQAGPERDVIRLLGQSYPYHVVRSERNGVEVEDDRILICAREPERFGRVLEKWWKENALAYYNLYVDKWMPVMAAAGCARPRVRVRKMKSMWGSCTHGKAEIRYSYYLLIAPPACVEYVVLHELAHLLYPDHGVRFKAFLTKHMPDWKARQNRMKQETRFIGSF